MTQREVGEAWERAILESGLPVVIAEGERPRPRISFGAPLQLGVAADAELIDVVLAQRLPAWRVREALLPRVPRGWTIADLHDVWLAGPPLAGRVAAADYRIELRWPDDEATPAAEELARALDRLNRATRIPRERAKGGGTVVYDLRPLLIGVELLDAGPPAVIRARTRFHPELGTGRPEEVAAAIGEAVGQSVETGSIVRERLILAEDLAAQDAEGRAEGR